MTTWIVKTISEEKPVEIKADTFEQISREHPIVVKFIKDREPIALISGVVSIIAKE